MHIVDLSRDSESWLHHNTHQYNADQLGKEFWSILATQTLEIHFQPIIDCQQSSVLGWEALSRGPENSSFRSPVVLFDFAEEYQALFELERICRERAIKACAPLPAGQKLFLNVHPRTLADPNFTPGETKRILDKYALHPEHVVLEITERHSIQDFSLFHKTLLHYREQGFKVAVDDAGAGYSGLRNIAQIRPDYIKIDMELVQGVDRDPVKRALLETMVTFADKIGSKIIAEGIETQTSLSCLVSMGVHYGQGYLFARPRFPRPEPDLSCLEGLCSRNPQELSCLLPIGRMSHSVHHVSHETPIAEIHRVMDKEGPLASVVVVEDDLPLGLIMSHHLDRHLSTRYGVALYYNRSVTTLMDKHPLIVDENTSVEQVAQQAMARESFKAYDDIIVTRKGRLLGVVSVQQMIDSMARAQVEMAKGANPLTGLPGNVALEQEIEKRSQQGKQLSLIYADLDNFKVYNDTYGFKQGDQIIQLLAQLLDQARKKHGHGSDFLSHIGGDDFVLITNWEQVESICQDVTRSFEQAVQEFYSHQDRQRGWIKAKGRDGREQRFPLVSVSLGVTFCTGQCTLQTIGERAAEIKHFAKSFPGNSYVFDRRSPLGNRQGLNIS